MCVCAMVISCGYYSRAAFILFRASDCAATFPGRPLFEEMRYILGESLLTIKTYQVMTSFSSMPNSAVEVKIKSTVSKNPEQLPFNTRVSAFARFAHWNLQ